MRKLLLSVLFFCAIIRPCVAANLLPATTSTIPSDTLGVEKNADPTFSTPALWTLNTWTISGGAAHHTAGVSDYLVPVAVSNIEKGKVYQTVFTVASTGGSVQASVGGVLGTTRTAGTFTQTLSVTTSTGRLGFLASSAFVGSVSGYSVKETISAIGTNTSYFSGVWRQNITGAVVSGDTSGIFSIVSGPGVNGKAYQIANTGSTDVVVTLTPTKALTVGRHYRPIVIAKRTVGSTAATYKLTGGTAVNITSSTFVPLAAPAVATNTTDKPTFTVPAGTTIQFYQPKLLDSADGVGFSFGNFDFRY